MTVLKKCRHRGDERERCRCSWYLRQRRGHRDVYVSIGPAESKIEAQRIVELRGITPPRLREIARAPGLDIPKQNGDPWVYFVSAAGLVKIGTTTDLSERMASIQAACPVALTLMLVVEGGKKAEHEFHRVFEVYRRHGEWFALPVGWENDPRLTAVRP
jgi:hypothetical protein